jgi:hypothetical protein
MSDRWNPHEILARLAFGLQRLLRAAGGQRYRVTPMRAQFVGEEIPGNRVWPGSQVIYLAQAERKPYGLSFRDGRIWDADGNLFDTTDAVSQQSGVGRAIFVMDADGSFYASKNQMIGEFHHSSLVAGEPVAAAGELEVVHGVLTGLSDRSGHYWPRRSFTDQAIDQLKKNNISLQRVRLDMIGGT